MPHKRRDGEETRKRILEAACRVFGELGYRDATNKIICDRAAANIAAINYHFGSKADLYRAAMQHAIDLSHTLYPIQGDLPADAPAHKRLHAFIASFINRHMDSARLGHLQRIRMTEHASPTGLVTDVVRGMIKRNRLVLYGILSELLGEGATKADVAFCGQSIISQCLFRPDEKMGMLAGREYKDERKRAGLIIVHNYRFSLAGIKALARDIRGRGGRA